jgi:hypothetical protein
MRWLGHEARWSCVGVPLTLKIRKEENGSLQKTRRAWEDNFKINIK